MSCTYSPEFKWLSTKVNGFPLASKESELQADDALREEHSPKFKSSDIFVATYPKTGTTLLQMICEVLRSRGDLDFQEITERQPWIELMFDMGLEFDMQQAYSPRIWKTHQALSVFPSNLKFITIVRSPNSVLQSFYEFGRLKGNPACTAAENASDFLIGSDFFRGPYMFGYDLWGFYMDLWKLRKERNVLILQYESLVQDLTPAINRIAKFMEVPVDDDLVNLTARMCSKDFMESHVEKFNDSYIGDRQKMTGRNGPAGIEPVVPKVVSSDRSALSQEAANLLASLWSERVASHTGMDSYNQFATEIVKASSEVHLGAA